MQRMLELIHKVQIKITSTRAHACQIYTAHVHVVVYMLEITAHAVEVYAKSQSDIKSY
jgi:hypothetical protein